MAKKQFTFARLPEADAAAYDKLAAEHGSLFCRTDWHVVLGPRARALGLYDGSGTLIGGVMLYEERRYGLKILRRAPYTQHAGPFFQGRSRNPSALLEEQDSVLRALLNFFDEEAPAICSFPLAPGFCDALPFSWAGYKVIPQITYRIDLGRPESEIWDRVASKCRNHIRKAEKDGVEVIGNGPKSDVLLLVRKTFDRRGKRIDRSALERVTKDFANSENSFWFVAYVNGIPSSCCFCVHDGQVAYNILAGYDQENSHHGAGPSVIWNAMRHAKERGLRVFDFEGSMMPEIEAYFRQFGGVRYTYLTVNRAWGPIECALKLVKRSVF